MKLGEILEFQGEESIIVAYGVLFAVNVFLTRKKMWKTS